MARLLLFCLINVISPTEAQDYPAPTLTVDPPIISETTAVTLNCQTPVQTSDCHFHLNRQHYKSSQTCQTALSGAELLSMVKKRPPVKITVSCFYDHTTYRSPDSGESIIHIGLLPPSLTVTSSVITEKDRVIFHCRPPDSVFSTQCHFYTANGQNFNNSKCRLTVRGSELLMLNQIPPVEIQVRCYYVFVWGQEVSASPHSENISLTVRRTTKKVPQPTPQLWPKPEISFEKYDDEVLIACSLPPAVTGSKCNLYFGESTQPYQTVKSQTRTNKIKLPCQLYVPVNEFWTNLRKVQSPEVSCDYTLENGSSSPHSDGYNSRVFIAKHFPNPTPEIITIFDQTKTSTRPNHETTGDPDSPGKEAQPQETTASVTTVTTTTRTNHGTGSYFDSVASAQPKETTASADTVKTTTRLNDVKGSDSDSARSGEVTQPVVTTTLFDPVKTTISHMTARNVMLMLVISVTVGIVLVGSVILVLAFLYIKQKENTNTGKHSMKPIAQKEVDKDDDNTYTLITSVPTANCSKGALNDPGHQSMDENESSPYHLYCTVPDPDEATSGYVDNVLYSSV